MSNIVPGTSCYLLTESVELSISHISSSLGLARGLLEIQSIWIQGGRITGNTGTGNIGNNNQGHGNTGNRNNGNANTDILNNGNGHLGNCQNSKGTAYGSPA
ncbi:MAG: hypothetical protein M3P08_12410 [Thermoproteota archaeon]|nr:hypothetical protein [Thermoproteota archaeon]